MTRHELDLIIAQIQCDQCRQRIQECTPRHWWIRRSEYHRTVLAILAVTAHAITGHAGPRS